MLSQLVKPSSGLRALDMQVARLTLQPGDAVVISTERLLTSHQANVIREHLSRRLPADVQTIVLSGGLAMTVLRHGDSTTADHLTPVCLAVDHRAAPPAPPAPPALPPRRP